MVDATTLSMEELLDLRAHMQDMIYNKVCDQVPLNQFIALQNNYAEVDGEIQRRQNVVAFVMENHYDNCDDIDKMLGEVYTRGIQVLQHYYE